MPDDDRSSRLARIRREPPPLRTVRVVERVELSPRLLRLTFEGDGLRELTVEQPAASVRLLVPSPGTDELVIPEWNGNEFLLPDGTRPALRTFTPLRVDNAAGRLDLEIVRHPGGAVSDWAESVAVGAPGAISGPGTGYDLPDADRIVVLADETALPAVTQIVAASPASPVLEIHVEVIRDDAVVDVEVRAGDTIDWHVTRPGGVPGVELVAVVTALDAVPDGTHVWAAGEASAMHGIRTHLFDTLGIERSRATVRGYWKPAR
jgi:NADPH-dependent ferric siderophore reductase